MKIKDLVWLAEEYCRHYHQQQKRRGGNQDPYEIHPFTVRDILVKYGFDSPESQAVALLHDTIEDTDLKYHKKEIEERFGVTIYHDVYILSKNTIGKYASEFSPLFKQLGVEYATDEGLLTPQAYKLRLLLSRNTVKRVKIADVIHNTFHLPDLNKASIEKKLADAETFYIPLGKAVAPIMVKELIKNIKNYKNSRHYAEIFGN